MIYGIGIDLQYIPQISEMVARQSERALTRIFTPAEITYCAKFRSPDQHYAARWAVKEAFYKAAGTGLAGEYRLTDVETVNLDSGKPHVILYGKALESSRQHLWRIGVSISHSGDYAIAQVVISVGMGEE